MLVVTLSSYMKKLNVFSLNLYGAYVDAISHFYNTMCADNNLINLC